MNQEQEIDLLVIGGGAAGLCTAAFAKLEGLNVWLCEKTDQVGGLTATSGGTIWVPGTHLSHEIGVPDTVEAAREYLGHVVKSERGAALREAFLDSGPQAIRDLLDNTEVALIASKAHPDYVSGYPGEAYGGRALAPLPFDGKRLGEDFKRIRPPRAEFMGLGGMMVNRNELDALLSPFASLSNFKTTISMVFAYYKDRLKYPRGTRLVMGNAFIAQLLYSLKQMQVPVLFETTTEELIYEDGRVVGAIIKNKEGEQRIKVRKGVVLATGGMGWNQALRQKYLPEGTWGQSMAPKTHTGDGLDLGLKAGAMLANEEMPAMWFPCSTHKKENGDEAVWPHINLDRAKPGLIAINSSGQRFVNESDSYHDFSLGQLAAHKNGVDSLPSYLICDDEFIDRYGLGLILPGAKNKNKFIKQGYLLCEPTLEKLAQRLNVPADVLESTVSRHNQYAETGVDTEFGKGSGNMNRFNGDADHGPNPCLGPIGVGPFYALAVRPVDLGSSMGLATDEFGQVLNKNQQPITGLYACGNDLASIFDGTYPGPGTTIGPGIVFGWRIAKHMTNRL